MKAVLASLVVLVGMASAANAAPAQETGAYPLGGGGWDGNNVRVSVVKSKLLAAPTSQQASAYPLGGGGWDANNVRVSVVRTGLLSK